MSIRLLKEGNWMDDAGLLLPPFIFSLSKQDALPSYVYFSIVNILFLSQHGLHPTPAIVFFRFYVSTIQPIELQYFYMHVYKYIL